VLSVAMLVTPIMWCVVTVAVGGRAQGAVSVMRRPERVLPLLWGAEAPPCSSQVRHSTRAEGQHVESGHMC